MFAAKSLTMGTCGEGQFADLALALVVRRTARNKMCRFAPSVALGARPSLFKFVVIRQLSQEAEDILDRVHVRTRDGARLLRPVGENRVRMARVGREPQHLGANRRELVDR
jgi:hypothetical protein